MNIGFGWRGSQRKATYFIWPIDIFKRVCSIVGASAAGIFAVLWLTFKLTRLPRGCCLPPVVCRHLWPTLENSKLDGRILIENALRNAKVTTTEFFVPGFKRKLFQILASKYK